MNVLLILAVITSATVQHVSKKIYNQKTPAGSAYTFSAINTLAAALFFVFSAGKEMHFTWDFIPYSIGFALSYGFGTVTSVIALLYGSMALTSLFISYSLILPTLYGILFLNEPVSPWLFIGIVLLLISLYFINYHPGENKITLRWLIYATIAALGNAGCTTLLKVQQLRFDGAYKNEFMIVALGIVFAAFAVFAIIKERDILALCLKKGLVWGGLCGGLNGMTNFIILILTGRMPVSLMFPLISAGGIVATSAVSVIIYKEKLSKAQLLGVILGIGAIVFLNI